MADWCHAFDFRAGKQGWKALVYGGKPHATWQDCVGWGRNNATTEARVIESSSFPQTVITKAEIHLSIPPTRDGTHSGPMYCFNTTTTCTYKRLYRDPALVYTIDFTNPLDPLSQRATKLGIGVDNDHASSQIYPWDGIITKIVLHGMGTNPFSCILEAFQTSFHRAPITNNPPDGSLSYSANRSYVVNEKFTDHVSQTWYRIASIGLDTEPCVNEDPYVEAALAACKGGVWVAPTAPPVGAGCATLPTSTKYTIPSVSWSGFSGTFSAWPLNIQDICSAEIREIHALGVGGAGVSYPRDTHNGVDLFVPNADTDVTVKSIDTGIVVGLGRGNNTQNTHAVWGSTNLDDGSPGWCLIVRYRHLYVLYGHLASISNNVWVGASVTTGQQIGTLGKAGDRHLHIEAHSYGATVTEGIGAENAAYVAPNGILPVGSVAQQTATDIVAPYHYDIMQLLPDPPEYSTQANGGKSVQQLVATESISGSNGVVDIVFGTNCTFTYRTVLPQPNNPPEAILKEVNGYRGFVGYGTVERPITRDLVSPLVQTQQP